MISGEDIRRALVAADARRHPSDQAYGIEGSEEGDVDFLIDGNINVEHIADALNEILANRAT